MSNAKVISNLKSEAASLQQRYDAFKTSNLALDMTRGKPGAEQLDLALPLLSILGASDFKSAAGVDCRNYGGVDGLPEAKKLFGEYLGAAASEVLIGGNSSLTLMHDTVERALLHGVPGSEKPWLQQGTVKFLCPTPGYDRHFAVCEHLGIEMIAVRSDANGPDMDQVEGLLAEDDSIKGIWLVPKYGNPTGSVCSDAVVERLSRLKAASDFRIMWDNAYNAHHLVDEPPRLKNMLEACKAAGNPDRVFVYGSTSKITFAGAGLSAMAASESNIAWMTKHQSFATIGPDKLNQLRHVKFFGDVAGIEAHMKKHAQVLRPRFAAVQSVLRNELGDAGLATWSDPKGGYFVSLDTLPGCAKRTVELAKDAGVKLTKAGATFPYGKDPNDSNIRIAPSLPTVEEITTAMEVLAVCIKLATLQRTG